MKPLITILFLILLALLSCTDETPTIVDSELQSFVQTFKEEAHKRGVKFNVSGISVQLKTNLTTFNGVDTIHCTGLYYHTKQGGQIWIDRHYYETSEYWCIERTVFHEFGHAMGRPHITEGISIMNLRLGYLRCYNNDSELRKQLIDELFTNIPH